MLDPDSVDLDELCLALDDRTVGTTWWIEPETGRIRPHVPAVDTESTDDLAGAGWVRVRSTESRESYRDMAEFVAAVQHRRASDLLDRAITGRGAFRRFKDTLFEFPELRDHWFRYRDARARRRALRWLAVAGLATREDAEKAAARHPDPISDDEDVPAALAVDLAMLYGDRLDKVLIIGTWARGEDRAPEGNLELIVVLRDLRAPWDELHLMDELLWRHTERSGVTVTALPVSPGELNALGSPLLARVAAEAVIVA